MDALGLSAARLEGERRLDVAIRSRRPQDANSWRNHAENRFPGYALSVTFRLAREPNPRLPPAEHFAPELYV
jgi:hypothetical protein